MSKVIANPATQEGFWSPRAIHQIKNFGKGGLALGSAAALVTSLVNYLAHLNKSRSDEDDDELRVRLKSASFLKDMAGTGTAIAAGTVGTIGSYALVKKLYHELRRRQAQKELDDAQNILLDVQGYEPVSKKASTRSDVTMGETLTGLPVALPLLLALGSGVVAYKGLQKAFPVIKKPTKAPRRIVIENAEEKENDKEVINKAANVRADDGTELMLRLLCVNKAACPSDIADVVGAIATGQEGAFRAAVDTIGFTSALDTVKNASTRADILPAAEHMAIVKLAHSPRLSAPAAVVAAAEFATLYPSFYKAAASLPESAQEAYAGLACIFGAAIREELNEEFNLFPKEASLTNDMLDHALSSLTKPKKDVPSSGTEDSESHQDGEPGAAASKKPKIIISSKTGKRVMDSLDGDLIDKILAAGT